MKTTNGERRLRRQSQSVKEILTLRQRLQPKVLGVDDCVVATLMPSSRAGFDILSSSESFGRATFRDQNNIIVTLSERGLWRTVLDLLGLMLRLTFPKSTTVANVALSACSKGQQWERVLMLLDETRKMRVVHTTTTYNIAIAAMEKRQLWEHAIGLLAEMSSLRFCPNVITFNSIMSACAQGLQWTLALMFFDDMFRFSIQRDIITYNVVISACEKCHQWQHALAMLHAVSKCRLEKSHTTFNAAISACDKGSQWQVPLHIFDLMKQEGVTPDIIAFNSAISGVERSQRWTFALLLMEAMMSSEVAFGTVGVRGVVSACEGSGHHGFALVKSISLLRRYTAELLYDRKDSQVGQKRLGAATFPVAHAIDSLHQHNRLKPSIFCAFNRAICARVISSFQSIRWCTVDGERSPRWRVRDPLLDRQFGLGSFFAREAVRSCGVQNSCPTWLVVALARTSRAVASTSATSAPMRHSLAAKSLVTFASYSLFSSSPSHTGSGWTSTGMLVGHGGVEFELLDA